jgi:hypothetical protein
MCFKLGELGRKFQAKYENVISKRGLYGSSNLYTKTMQAIRKREGKEDS